MDSRSRASMWTLAQSIVGKPHSRPSNARKRSSAGQHDDLRALLPTQIVSDREQQFTLLIVGLTGGGHSDICVMGRIEALPLKRQNYFHAETPPYRRDCITTRVPNRPIRRSPRLTSAASICGNRVDNRQRRQRLQFANAKMSGD